MTLLLAGTSLTFLQNYTALLFCLGETNVCPLGISQRFWQQAADEEKWKFQQTHRRQTGAGYTEVVALQFSHQRLWWKHKRIVVRCWTKPLWWAQIQRNTRRSWKARMWTSQSLLFDFPPCSPADWWWWCRHNWFLLHTEQSAERHRWLWIYPVCMSAAGRFQWQGCFFCFFLISSERQQRADVLPRSLAITFSGTWGSTSFTCWAILAMPRSSAAKLWTMKPRPMEEGLVPGTGVKEQLQIKK